MMSSYIFCSQTNKAPCNCNRQQFLIYRNVLVFSNVNDFLFFFVAILLMTDNYKLPNVSHLTIHIRKKMTQASHLDQQSRLVLTSWNDENSLRIKSGSDYQCSLHEKGHRIRVYLTRVNALVVVQCRCKGISLLLRQYIENCSAKTLFLYLLSVLS